MSQDQSDRAGTTSKQDRPVLVAVDFSADAEAALIWACRHAERTKARIQALHVVHDPGEAPGYYKRGEQDVLRPLSDVAADMMAEFLERVAKENPGLKEAGAVEPILVTGIPETRILEIAKANNARIIVMGSRGRTGLPHLLMGSKAERVVQLSPIPVTIVKAQTNDDQ